MRNERDFAIIVDRSWRKRLDGKEKLVVGGAELSLKPNTDWNCIIKFEGSAYFIGASVRTQVEGLSIHHHGSSANLDFDFIVTKGSLPSGTGLLTNRADCRLVYDGEVDFGLISNEHLPGYTRCEEFWSIRLISGSDCS
jgi:hypothetical protein